MTEGFLLRNDGDVVGARVLDQRLRVCRRQRAARQGWQRIRRVLHGVFEVGRVQIELVCGEGADLLFLVGEGRHGSAREIVVHAAPAHGRPVANGRSLEDRSGAAATFQLDERLHAVEDARGRVPNDESLMRAGNENVAFGLHRRVEGHLFAMKNAACRGVAVTQQPDAEGRRCLRHANPANLERIGQRFRGKAIVGISAGHENAHPAGEGEIGAGGELARLGNEGGPCCGLGADSNEREREEDKLEDKIQDKVGRGALHRSILTHGATWHANRTGSNCESVPQASRKVAGTQGDPDRLITGGTRSRVSRPAG